MRISVLEVETEFCVVLTSGTGVDDGGDAAPASSRAEPVTIDRTPYFTPNELFQSAAWGDSRADVPGKQAGNIRTVTRSVAGTGRLGFISYCIDEYPTTIEVVTPGDIGTAEFIISTDGTASFTDPILSDPNALQNQRWDYEIGITGIQLQAFPGNF